MAVHGFRMPVLFLVGGFFTAMLWQRRGLRGLIIHRIRRIGLPLGLAVVTLVPLTVLALSTGTAISGRGRQGGGEELLGGFQFFHLWFLLILPAGFAACVIAAGAVARLWGRSRPLGPSGPPVAAAEVSTPMPAADPLVPVAQVSG